MEITHLSLYREHANGEDEYAMVIPLLLHKEKGFSYIKYGHSLLHYWECSDIWKPPSWTGRRN